MSETVHVCETTPEKLCGVNIGSSLGEGLIARLPQGVDEECNVHYKTVCETKFEEKEIEEDMPICNDILEKSCNDDGENCGEIMKRVRMILYTVKSRVLARFTN